MKCLPYESKKVSSSDGKFFWCLKNTLAMHSFNDQPAWVSHEPRTMLVWQKKNQRHRKYNKPAVINMNTGKYIWCIDDIAIKNENIFLEDQDQ